MNKKFYKKIIPIFLAVSTFLSGCATLFPTQRMIDDILPGNAYHYYCEADLIPYSKEELYNATTLYSHELAEFYYLNVEKYDENIVEEVDEDAKNEFMARLTYMNSNYKMIKERYEKYAGEEGATKDDIQKVDAEFNDFYKLPNSKFAKTAKEYNSGLLAGSPTVSIDIDVSTLKNNGIYYDATAKIYEHVTLDEKKIKKLKIGDEIELDFPESNKDENNTNMRKAKLVYVATNSFIEYNTNVKENDTENIYNVSETVTEKIEEALTEEIEETVVEEIEETLFEETNEIGNIVNDQILSNASNDSVYYITPVDPLSKKRSLINADGEVIEVYKGEEVVQIMKDARIASGIDETRLVTQILRSDPGTINYTINDICAAHEGGGYVNELYKDNIYLNTIYTNLKGYITSGYWYKQMYIDNAYAVENNSKYITISSEIGDMSEIISDTEGKYFETEGFIGDLPMMEEEYERDIIATYSEIEEFPLMEEQENAIIATSSYINEENLFNEYDLGITE